jgi:hypothetical protein
MEEIMRQQTTTNISETMKAFEIIRFIRRVHLAWRLKKAIGYAWRMAWAKAGR